MAAMTFLQWHLLSLKMAGTGYDASSSSTINQLVCGLMENPHFLDVLERTSRRINSPQMTSQPAASCSTSSSRPFQTPVEEFRSLFRTGTAYRHLYLDSADSLNGQEAVLMLQAVQGRIVIE